MQRPTAITVLAILNIVFAVLGVLVSLSSVMLFLVTANGTDNPVIQLIQNNAAYAAYLKFSIGLGVVMALVLLAAGIGLLGLKPWGRTLSIIYSIVAIVLVVAGWIANYFFLVLPMLQQAREEQGPQAAAAMGGAIGGMVGGCFGFIYPVLLLIFMTRPHIAAAFNPPVSPVARSPHSL